MTTTNPRLAASVAEILATPDPVDHWGTADIVRISNHITKGDRVPTHGVFRRAHLDLGATKADRTWHVTTPGRTNPNDEYRDACGPIRENVGCTVRTLDYIR